MKELQNCEGPVLIKHGSYSYLMQVDIPGNDQCNSRELHCISNTKESWDFFKGGARIWVFIALILSFSLWTNILYKNNGIFDHQIYQVGCKQQMKIIKCCCISQKLFCWPYWFTKLGTLTLTWLRDIDVLLGVVFKSSFCFTKGVIQYIYDVKGG